MAEETLPATFRLSYVPTLDDIAEVAGRQVRTARRNLLRRLALILLMTVLVIALMMQDAAVGPGSADGLGYVLFGAVIGWMLALVYVNAAALSRLSSRRVARRRREVYPSLRTEYEVTVSAEGLMSRTADVALNAAWAAFTAIEETGRQFLLIGHDGGVAFALPKHGLPDQGQAGPLRDFLRARVGPAR